MHSDRNEEEEEEEEHEEERRIAPEPNDSSSALTASVVFRKAPTHKRGRDAENGIDTVELYCCTGTVVIKHG